MPELRQVDTLSGASRSEKRLRRDLSPEVPDHEILRLIGTGAYGEVWLARSVTGAYRAVKVVWREDFKDESIYVREFESILHYEPVARRIPGVVHILHVGQHHGEFPYYYYVMELADDAYTGIHIDPLKYVPHTLHSDMELYGRNPMPLDYVIEVGSQLAHALDGLHAEELTHRDVKPSNIVFVNGRAKLADVGSVAQSNNRSFAGTQGYVPPEGPGAPRADVYALAKVLYEMSTGKDRLDFPELPENIPSGPSHRHWLAFNEVVCAAAAPQVNKDTIATAQVLAERLDSLRQYTPGRRAKRRQTSPWYKRLLVWCCVLAGLAALCYGVFALLLPPELRQRLHAAVEALRAPIPEDAVDTGRSQLFITSVPSGASIYTEDGRYVDETPYGPLDVTPGKKMIFTLRKEGFADYEVQGITPQQGLLALGGDLHPYRPPKPRQDWQDALGAVYKAEDNEHRAVSPVTVQQFETFLRSDPATQRFPYEKAADGDSLLTTRDGINAFTLWLLRLCESQGSIGRDHSLAPTPEPGTTTDDKLCSYRLIARPVQKTPISVHTTPTGATVWLNGRPLGATPLQGVRIPLAPFLLEVRMPGYDTVRRSGISPKGLALNLNLEPNNSVSFGAEWTNSLGLCFRPFTPSLMAGATEVRVSDYRAFVASTGAAMPPHTNFVQSGDHPVVNVSRVDAERFARWLTIQEREAGLIEETDEYRLPTDEEWSSMVGIKEEKGASPYERAQNSGLYTAAGNTPASIPKEFPWGLAWPPPAHSGNFSDTSARAYVSPQYVLEHYTDGFPFTAPVMSFSPNKFGIYDLSGNVQEWVSGEYGGPPGFNFRHYGVTRGSDFTSFRPNQIISGSRTPRPIDERSPSVGFRLMLERTQKSL